jgi:hypothetical protein
LELSGEMHFGIGLIQIKQITVELAVNTSILKIVSLEHFLFVCLHCDQPKMPYQRQRAGHFSDHLSPVVNKKSHISSWSVAATTYLSFFWQFTYLKPLGTHLTWMRQWEKSALTIESYMGQAIINVIQGPKYCFLRITNQAPFRIWMRWSTKESRTHELWRRPLPTTFPFFCFLYNFPVNFCIKESNNIKILFQSWNESFSAHLHFPAYFSHSR